MAAEVVHLPVDGKEEIGVLGLYPHRTAVVLGAFISQLWSWPLLMVAVDAEERAGEVGEQLFPHGIS